MRSRERREHPCIVDKVILVIDKEITRLIRFDAIRCDSIRFRRDVMM